MKQFTDPTPRIERASRQTFGVIVSVSADVGTERTGFPGVVKFKGREYQCSIFGEDLVAGDAVHFVEAGGLTWAIKRGSYYTTTYRKKLKEWLQKHKAGAAIAYMMRKNRKAYRYRTGFVATAGGETATAKLDGETATRTFPVEFEGKQMELSESYVGKRCLAFTKPSGQMAILPSSVAFKEATDGAAPEDQRWPEDDEYESQDLGFGFVVGLSRSGGGALMVCMICFTTGGTISWGYGTGRSNYEITNVEWYPKKVRAVTAADKTSWAPWRPDRMQIPFINCGDYIVWLQGTSTSAYQTRMTIMNRETGTTTQLTSYVNTYLPPPEIFIDIVPYSSTEVLLLSFNTLQDPGVGGPVGYRIDRVNVATRVRTNLFQGTWDQQGLFPGTGQTTDWQTPFACGPFYGPDKRFMVNNGGYPYADPTSIAFFSDTELPTAFAHDQSYYQQLRTGDWFHPTGGGRFVRGAYQETNQAQYDTLVADSVQPHFTNASLLFSGDPAVRSTWHLRADHWKSRIMASRNQSLWQYNFAGDTFNGANGRIMEYNPQDNTWRSVGPTYQAHCPASFYGFAGRGSDDCYYVITTEQRYNSTYGKYLDYNHVTRFRSRL